jgi:hypothetical protein
MPLLLIFHCWFVNPQVGAQGITYNVLLACMDVLMKHEFLRVKLGDGCGLERKTTAGERICMNAAIIHTMVLPVGPKHPSVIGGCHTHPSIVFTIMIQQLIYQIQLSQKRLVTGATAPTHPSMICELVSEGSCTFTGIPVQHGVQ